MIAKPLEQSPDPAQRVIIKHALGIIYGGMLTL